MNGGQEHGILLTKDGIAMVSGQAIAEQPLGEPEGVKCIGRGTFRSRRRFMNWPLKANMENFPGMSSVST